MSLFVNQDRDGFMKLTYSRYRHMGERPGLKKIQLPFSLADLREYVFAAMNGYSGSVNCLYCRRVCTLADVDFDHAIPLSRGGSPALENISFPCAECNARKGEMTPKEYIDLLVFLETNLPFARVSILKRLQEHSKLLAGKRRAEALVRNSGAPPPKKRRQACPPLLDAGF
jgi:hypothetical protein